MVEQVSLNLGVLRDPEATHATKVEALFFLVHFVGDVHQPMHLGRASDRGGNSIQVTFNGRKTNLHSLWDTGLLVHTELSHEEYLQGLIRQTRSNAGDRLSWARELDPVVWANESHRLAHSNAYVVPKNGRIGDAYYRRNIRVVNERLAMTGVRLAEDDILPHWHRPQRQKPPEQVSLRPCSISPVCGDSSIGRAPGYIPAYLGFEPLPPLFMVNGISLIGHNTRETTCGRDSTHPGYPLQVLLIYVGGSHVA